MIHWVFVVPMNKGQIEKDLANSKIFSRRDFLRKAGFGLVGLLSACHASNVDIEELLTPSSTAFQAITVTPRPTEIPATATPTFTPTQLSSSISDEEIEFLAEHEVQEGDTNRPVVMMTYDDNAKYADVRAILDAYNRHNVKATFFFIGEKVTLSSKAVHAIVDEGHLLGCHGYEHINLLNLNDDQINRQIEKAFDAVNEVVPGYQMRFIRFPFGEGTSDPRLLKIAANWGLQHVRWTMGSGGLDNETYDNVMRNVQNGSIVLSHMFRPYDVAQVEDIVTSLIDRGFSLETVETGRKQEDIYI